MQISQKVLNKRDRLLTKVQQENAVQVLGRADHKMAGVMISNRRVKTASKYKITELPHPFTSVEEYERSLQMPLGGTSLVWCWLDSKSTAYELCYCYFRRVELLGRGEEPLPAGDKAAARPGH
jgi:hypothetical protein